MRLEKTIFGNGEPGMDENVRNLVEDVVEIKGQLQRIVDHTGPTRSELEAMKKAIFMRLNLDALGNPKHYDENNHPNRRASDQERSTFDKVVGYFVEKVLPQLIVWVILAFIAFQIALNQHIIIGG